MKHCEDSSITKKPFHFPFNSNTLRFVCFQVEHKTKHAPNCIRLINASKFNTELKLSDEWKSFRQTWFVRMNTASHEHNHTHSSTFLSPVAVGRQCMCGERPYSGTANVSNYSYIALTALASGVNEHGNPCTGALLRIRSNRIFRCFVFIESFHTDVCHIEESPLDDAVSVVNENRCTSVPHVYACQTCYFVPRERVEASDSSRRHQFTHACGLDCTRCCLGWRWIGKRRGLAFSSGELVSLLNDLRINVRGWIYGIVDGERADNISLLVTTQCEMWILTCGFCYECRIKHRRHAIDWREPMSRG